MSDLQGSDIASLTLGASGVTNTKGLLSRYRHNERALALDEMTAEQIAMCLALDDLKHHQRPLRCMQGNQSFLCRFSDGKVN